MKVINNKMVFILINIHRAKLRKTQVIHYLISFVVSVTGNLIGQRNFNSVIILIEDFSAVNLVIMHSM